MPSTEERSPPTLAELSSTSTRSTCASHGGGARGGDGGAGGSLGGNGTTMPQSWTASTCSYPELSVVIRIVFDWTLPSLKTVSAEPHDVESPPCQMVVAAPLTSRASTLVTNGALYVS
eukprot:1790484-Prymnesium_polylepis.1